jgi:hypothetical protein
VSRASDLRDALRDILKAAFPEVQVDSAVVPTYDREELLDPRICVMISTRNIDATQGPDTRDVVLSIGVLAATPELEGPSLDEEQRREQELKATDAFDDLFEQVLALWTPTSTAQQAYLDVAEHRWRSIEQTQAIDFSMYRERGVWLAVAFVTYRDNRDD